MEDLYEYTVWQEKIQESNVKIKKCLHQTVEIIWLLIVAARQKNIENWTDRVSRGSTKWKILVNLPEGGSGVIWSKPNEVHLRKLEEETSGD